MDRTQSHYFLPNGSAGYNAGNKLPRRHRRFVKDSILGITKPGIRRPARRGGVKRISTTIYDTVRQVLKLRLAQILHYVVEVIRIAGASGGKGRQTITTLDIVFALKQLGSAIYGFGGDCLVQPVPKMKRVPEPLSYR